MARNGLDDQTEVFLDTEPECVVIDLDQIPNALSILKYRDL